MAAIMESSTAAPAQRAVVPEEEQCFKEIDRLQEVGINAADIKKLKESGYHTTQAILCTNRRVLMQIKGFSDAKVDKIMDAVRKMSDGGFVTGTVLRERMQNRFRVSTGATKFDQMLGGGVESGSITELYGEFRCGKTQICHSMSVIAQLPPEHGGANGKVAYIDTEGTFRCERIAQIAAKYQIDPSAVLDNICYARCYSSDHLMDLLIQIAARMAEEKFALIIVDSIMGTLRVDFSGRGDLAERQQCLSKIMSRLQKLSEEYNAAILITNQVMSDPSGAMAMAMAPPKPVGGHVLAHLSTTRVQLRKGRGEQRVAKLVDSPSMPETECVYAIAEVGIIDAQD